MFTGDCFLPLLHKAHSGLTRPQKSGPEKYKIYIHYKMTANKVEGLTLEMLHNDCERTGFSI